MDSVTQQNASVSEELTSMAEELSSQAQALQDVVQFFKIDIGQTTKPLKHQNFLCRHSAKISNASFFRNQ